MIHLQGVEKLYINGSGKHRSEVLALRGIDLDIKQGEFVIVRGGSGSGKTTLLQLLGGLMAPTQGSISINEQQLDHLSDEELSRFRSTTIGFIFQDYNLIPHLSVLDNVMVPALFVKGVNASEVCKRAKALLTEVGLGDKIREFPAYLSGGQKQRVAIARALLLHPRVILADEPTGNLDQETGHQIEELLYQLSKTEEVTVILVTHEESYHQHADRVIVVEQGLIRKA